MSKKKTNIDVKDLMRKRVAAVCLGDKVDRRTHISLYKYGLVTMKVKDKKDISQSIERALKETDDRCTVCGPHIFYVDTLKNQCIAIKLSEAILSFDSGIRKSILDYLMEHCGKFMSPYTISILENNKICLLSKNRTKWTSAAIAISDAIENDWEFNCQGLLQALTMNHFDAAINEYMTKILRPETNSFTLIRKKGFSPHQDTSEIKNKIQEIVLGASTFGEALRDYYNHFGHIPLGGELSICAFYDKWLETKGEIANIWEIFWNWANGFTNPLPRYHACNFFTSKPNLIPTEKKTDFVQEFVSVVCLDKNEKGEWYEAWMARCVLARYFCEYIECRHPGASGERIATHSWWLADQVCKIFDSNIENTRIFREGMVEPEENLVNIVWQMVRCPTEHSTLRYGTLYLKSIWSLALISQLNSDTLDVLFSNSTKEQELAIFTALMGNLVNLFPINTAKEQAVYAFDNGCIEAARAASRFVEKDDRIDMLKAFIDGVEKVTDENVFRSALKHMPQGNEGDHVLTIHTMHILSNMDSVPKEFIWECLQEKDWLKGAFGNLKTSCDYRFCEGLREIQLRTKGIWDEQLPHIFATMCEEFKNEPEKKTLLFSYAIISSLAADSVSAIDRLLNGQNRFDYRQEVNNWRLKIEQTFPLVPEWCRARLRATLASLHI